MKNAIILAAGSGKRLKKFGLDKPKSLFEINDKPLLYYTLEKLLFANYTKITVVTGYCSDQIESYVSNNFKDIKTLYNKNYSSHGNFESLKTGLIDFGNVSHVTVLDADLIFDRNILNLIETDKNMIFTSTINDNHDPVYVKTFNNQILFLSKKIKYSIQTNHEYIGILNLNKSNIEALNNIEFEGYMDYEEVIHKNKMFFTEADVSNQSWFELDDEIHLQRILHLSKDIKGKLFD